MKENIFGEGLDIPMLGIRMACQELWPDKVLEIFDDPVFQMSNHFKLSTSQVGRLIRSLLLFTVILRLSSTNGLTQSLKRIIVMCGLTAEVDSLP